MRILLQIFSVLISIPIFTSFTPTTPRPVHLAKLPSRLLPTHLSSSYLDSLTLPSPSLSNIQSLKSELFSAIKELNKLKEKEGDFSIDFGVKGGELDKKSRRPAKVRADGQERSGGILHIKPRIAYQIQYCLSNPRIAHQTQYCLSNPFNLSLHSSHIPQTLANRPFRARFARALPLIAVLGC